MVTNDWFSGCWSKALFSPLKEENLGGCFQKHPTPESEKLSQEGLGFLSCTHPD